MYVHIHISISISISISIPLCLSLSLYIYMYVCNITLLPKPPWANLRGAQAYLTTFVFFAVISLPL